MVSIYVLVVSFAGLRLAGFLGVKRLNQFSECLRFSFAVMFIFTGVSHFTTLKDDFVRMIPFEALRNEYTVYFTGVIEIGGALWLAWGGYIKLVCLLLILFLLAVLPANIYASLNDIPIGGRAPTEMYTRITVQALYIALLVYVGWEGHFKKRISGMGARG